ncbi:MAG: plastocyanin [Sneathiella sp.]|nr:plastocyanin [Sneathiella sp.]
MKSNKRIFATLPAGILVGLGLMASGAVYAGGSHGGGHGNKGQAFGEPGAASDVVKTIPIELGDNFFSPEKLSFEQGQTVRFTVVNKGEFVHEFNIGTQLMHADHQKEMAMMMEHGAIEVDRINHDKMKMDMGNGHMMSHDDPNSILLEPGQSGEVIWKFAASGELEFACNLPGHYESGMVGEISID